MTSRLHCTSGTLHERADATAFVPVVPAKTLLLDLAQLIAQHECRHVLVQNEQGGLLGVVTVDDLQNAMRDQDGSETAWHHRCVESLLHLTLTDIEPRHQNEATESVRSETDCVSVRQGNDLVALVTEEDLLLSWARLSPALQRTSLDVLTQLPNRAYFERRFREEWQRAARLGLSLGVLIIDVDHFKEINDRFGHPRGDLVLASVAACLQKQFRSYDLVARYAGDEFVALTCGCSMADIELPITRLRHAIQELVLQFGDQQIPVSLSVGAAVMNCVAPPMTPEVLLDAADQALYSAKRNGRDCAFRTELLSCGTILDPVRIVPARVPSMAVSSIQAVAKL